MNIKLRSYIILIIFLLVVNLSIYSDRIILQNDNVVKGEILSESEELVKVKTSGGIIDINAEEIKEIQRENLFSEFIKLKEIDYGAGDFEEILDEINRNAKGKKDLEQAKESLLGKSEFVYKNIAKNSNRYNPDVLETSLSKFVEEEKDDRFTFLIFQIFNILRDRPKAIQYCMQISPGFYELHPYERKEVLTFLSDMIQSLSQKDEIKESFEIINYISKIDSEVADSLKIIIYLRLAYIEFQNGFFENAIQIYIKDLMPISKEIALSKIAESMRKKVGNLLEKAQYKEAEDIFYRYAVYLSRDEKQEILSDILQKYAKFLFAEGDYLQAKEKYSEYYKVTNSSDNSMIKRCEYEIRLKEIDKG